MTLLGRMAALLATLAVVTACGSGASAAGDSLPLRVVARLPLSGPPVRFDYLSLDPTTDRLWVAHMDADQLLAVDVRRRRIVKTVPAPGVHGVIAVPSLHRVYASATNDHRVLTIDSRSGLILARAPAGDYPDGLAYDPRERRVFVSDEHGGVETVIDVKGRPVRTVDVGGEAGNVQYDPGSGHMLVDVQSRDDIAVIDPRTNRIVRRLPLPGCDEDHGLYVDAPRRLAFIACAGNARLLTLDLRRMAVTGSASVGRDPDVLAFDASLRRLYVASESGEVAVFAERGRSLAKLGQAELAPNAHSIAVDPRSHRVYIPLQSGSAGRPELLVLRPA